MIDPNFNPYDDLVELKKFSHVIDQHITQIKENEKAFMLAINDILTRQELILKRLAFIEGILIDGKDSHSG